VTDTSTETKEATKIQNDKYETRKICPDSFSFLPGHGLEQFVCRHYIFACVIE